MKSSANKKEARHVEIKPTPLASLGRNTVGGRPILVAGQEWPSCHCGQRMVLFFQLDIPRVDPFEAKSHLLVFQCPVHNDAVFPPKAEQLPPAFWAPPLEVGGPFWRIFLNRPGSEVVAAEAEPHLVPAALKMVRADPDAAEIQVGGAPSWLQDPEHYRCSCGAEMAFLCQIPGNFGFVANPGQPEQPNSFSSKEYCLFLGNEIYIHACSAQCQPMAVWPINQN